MAVIRRFAAQQAYARIMGDGHGRASHPHASASGSRERRSGRREQIRRHIEAHLNDPQLTPARVAAALHLSTRYLHQVFNRDGETVARYILRRRVEECARALHDGAQAACSVTEIAFRHGFNDASHFGRVFRACYGVTPREYRRRAVSGMGHTARSRAAAPA